MARSSKVEDLPPEHQVFINYHGKDIHNEFINLLITTLESNNINVVYFNNNKDRRKLLKVVVKRLEESRVALVILSTDYTESTRCLKELAKIKDRVEKNNLVAIPIFYKLQPSICRGLWYGDEFRDLVVGEARKKREWKNALRWIQNIEGPKVHEESSVDDITEVIMKVVEKVLKEIPLEGSQNASVDMLDSQSSLRCQSNGSNFSGGESNGSSLSRGESKDSSFLGGESNGSSLSGGESNGSSLSGGKSNGSNLSEDESISSGSSDKSFLKVVKLDLNKNEGTVEEHSLEQCGEIDIIGEAGSSFTSTVEEQSLQHRGEMNIIGEVGSSSASTVEKQSLQHQEEVGSFSASTVEEQSLQHCGEMGIVREVGSFSAPAVEEQSLQHHREMGIIRKASSFPMARSSSFEGDIKENVKKVDEMVKKIPSEGSQKAYVDLSESQILSADKDDKNFGTKQSLKELEEQLDLNKCEGTCIIREVGYSSASTIEERSLQHRQGDLRYGFVSHLVKAMKSYTFRIQLGLVLGCVLLLLVMQQIAYMTVGFNYQGGATDGVVGNVQKKNIPTEVTNNFPVGEVGAKHRSSIPEAKTNADFVDRTVTNSLKDSKDKPPQIQVFINFRGEQLRSNFICYLVDALQRNEINVFVDYNAPRGEEVNSLFKRIEDSGIAIVVLSSRYTESKWCLEELVKIKEREKQHLLKVLPIFYKVSPTNVKRLKGEFGDHFRDQEEKYECNEPKIKRWKEAISFVPKTFALHLDEKSTELEIDFVERIVKEVLKMLRSVSTVESGQSSR